MTGSARRLILIRHSAPQIDPKRSAHDWVLSEEGVCRCDWLASRLADFGIQHVWSSVEPKSKETAELLARRLSVPWETAEGLQEQSRHTVPLYESEEAFETAIRPLFQQPDRCAFGEESALQARARFHQALRSLLGSQPTNPTAVVSHGTVMSLLVAEANDLDPLQFWKELTTPCFVILRVPGFSVQGLKLWSSSRLD